MVKDGEGVSLRHGTRYAGVLACKNPVSRLPVEGFTRFNNTQGFYLVEAHCFATGPSHVNSGR
jgi:hypothetical protein